MEPASHYNLALALDKAGEYQRAFDLLWFVRLFLLLLLLLFSCLLYFVILLLSTLLHLLLFALFLLSLPFPFPSFISSFLLFPHFSHRWRRIPSGRRTLRALKLKLSSTSMPSSRDRRVFSLLLLLLLLLFLFLVFSFFTFGLIYPLLFL